MELTREEWKDWAAVMAVKEVKPPDSSLYGLILQMMAMSPQAYCARELQLAAYMHGCTCFVCYQNRQSQGGLYGLLGGLGGFGAGLGGYAAQG